eukprot:2153568-Amphidinium_carterae.1
MVVLKHWVSESRMLGHCGDLLRSVSRQRTHQRRVGLLIVIAAASAHAIIEPRCFTNLLNTSRTCILCRAFPKLAWNRLNPL